MIEDIQNVQCIVRVMSMPYYMHATEHYDLIYCLQNISIDMS